MNHRLFWIPVFALLASLIFPGTLLAEESTTTPATVKMTVIKPGEAQRCKTDFIVENLDGETADLKVVLGHKVYVDELLNPRERRAFSLPGTIMTAKFHGHNVPQEDAAVIINLGPKADIQLRCIQLPVNPPPQKDDLAVFK
ncbi:hypothetical protein [Nitrospina watsonii]|uniref:EfeO-type cupredoxin-like domain-containing protein n=1 Tax=Nitrospina watsonii TaxID=1323948 RepID=A0ABM9HG61_9BACT|nr:hypothetical protein [Nitrospina watsonii]CAI2719146.1 conserved exported protein of unknown function [Nitrospina watsonii]